MANADPHDKAREDIFIELVIMPTVGDANQVGKMYFGYNEIKRQGDDDLQYLQNAIQTKHPGLNVSDPGVVVSLRNILRDWHPEFGSQGRYTIQIRGELKLDDSAKTGTDSAERQRLQKDLDDAQQKVLDAAETAKMVLRNQAKQNKEWQELGDRLAAQHAADLRDKDDQLQDLARRLTDANAERGHVQAALDELNCMLPPSQQSDGQLRADLYDADQKIVILQQKIDELTKSSGNGPAWRTATPPGGEPPPSYHDHDHDTGPTIAPQPPGLSDDTGPRIARPGKPLAD